MPRRTLRRLTLRRLTLLSATLATVVALPGCLAAAAGAGAGAGAAVFLTTRGASALVEGSIDQVAARAEAVLQQREVTVTARKSESSGAERELEGTVGEHTITVSLQRNSATTTHLEVAAKKGAVQWDKDLAKQIAAEIVRK